MARQFTDEERERMTRGGEWLRAERERQGFKHGTEFADALGIRSVRLSAYERGLYPIPERIARDIARVLGLSEWEVWLGLQLPLPRELADDEAIQRALALRPDVMAQVPEIVEKVTGAKLKDAPPVPRNTGSRGSGGPRSGDRRRNTDTGKESAV